MKNPFIDKVAVQRRALSIINSVGPESSQLAGLSSAAIDCWCRMTGVHPTDDSAKALHRIAMLCQCLSDRSHESFKTLDVQLNDEIESELADLKRITVGINLGG
jgi:hypothetical protein